MNDNSSNSISEFKERFFDLQNISNDPKKTSKELNLLISILFTEFFHCVEPHIKEDCKEMLSIKLENFLKQINSVTK